MISATILITTNLDLYLRFQAILIFDNWGKTLYKPFEADLLGVVGRQRCAPELICPECV